MDCKVNSVTVIAILLVSFVYIAIYLGLPWTQCTERRVDKQDGNVDASRLNNPISLTDEMPKSETKLRYISNEIKYEEWQIMKDRILEKPAVRENGGIMSMMRGLPYWQRDDPEAYMNASQLIVSKGFPCEIHDVHTQDGYILGMQRMTQSSENRLPVLLMHGLLSSSDCFLTNLVNESLAYILYNSGYDVWLGNVRGNTYSKRHVTIPVDTVKFWDWSFDEMGKYDVPAMVDYVLKTTGKNMLNYIGHSQGTTCLFTAAMGHGSSFSKKINLFIALAPAALVPGMLSPLHFLTYIANDIELVYNLFGEGDFLPHSGIISKLAKLFCPHDEKLCENVLFLFGGSDLRNTNKSRVPVYTAHNPAGTSTHNMIHWAQMVKNKKDMLVYFDYGHWYLNMWHYKSIHPPSYDFSKFQIPTYVFCGERDTLVVLNDCKRLLSVLPNVTKSYIVRNYTHLDFIWAMNSPTVVYESILTILTS